jgi:hypothetical protein
MQSTPIIEIWIHDVLFGCLALNVDLHACQVFLKNPHLITYLPYYNAYHAKSRLQIGE